MSVDIISSSIIFVGVFILDLGHLRTFKNGVLVENLGQQKHRRKYEDRNQVSVTVKMSIPSVELSTLR